MGSWLWVRISPSVHHVVTSTDVFNMAESKEKFKRCLSVLLVLDELEETEDKVNKVKQDNGSEDDKRVVILPILFEN